MRESFWVARKQAKNVRMDSLQSPEEEKRQREREGKRRLQVTKGTRKATLWSRTNRDDRVLEELERRVER